MATHPFPTPVLLVIGASSAIGNAYWIRKTQEHPDWRVVLISRGALTQETNHHVTCLQSDYSAESIQRVSTHLSTLLSRNPDYQLSEVLICNGLLHEGPRQPEKRLADFDTAAFQSILTACTITPLLWIQALRPLLKKSRQCTVVVFSARVGSIEDNRLGGWYSYRASKAALNMLLKTASIELRREAKGCRLIAYHPGTVNSPLSRPFQRNVPAHKLFTPNYAAERLDKVLQSNGRSELQYLDWQGEAIPW